MESDPRVFFAAERTLLAWVRTGIAIVGLGFVVAKFGLFLTLLRAEHPAASAAGAAAVATSREAALSGWLGIGFVLLGALAMALAAIQHARFIATLPPHDRPAAYQRHWATALAAALCVASAALAGHLAFAVLPG